MCKKNIIEKVMKLRVWAGKEMEGRDCGVEMMGIQDPCMKFPKSNNKANIKKINRLLAILNVSCPDAFRHNCSDVGIFF